MLRRSLVTSAAATNALRCRSATSRISFANNTARSRCWDASRYLSSKPAVQKRNGTPKASSSLPKNRAAKSRSSERRRQHEDRHAEARRKRQEAQQRQSEMQQAAQQRAQERQRLHQMRVDEARRARDEANKRHRELQKVASQKTRDNLRKNAARSIPYWLGKNPVCLEMTMNALNVELKRGEGLRGHERPSYQNSIESEYRQMYLDSVPSFFLKITEDPMPDDFVSTLDLLVEAGFADLGFAKKHRRQLEREQETKAFAAVLSRKVKKVEACKKQLQEEQKVLRELETTRPVLDKSATKEDDKGIFEKAVSVFASVFQQPEKDAPTSSVEDEAKHLYYETELLQFETRLEKQQKVVDHAELALQKAERQIEYLKERNAPEDTLLNDDKYAKANAVMEKVLKETICPGLASHIHERHASMIDQWRTLDANTDLTKPHEWFTHARLDQRKIIFHGGPTNSGKTYSALQRLREAKKGLYLGPLRLLAAEVYETLTSQGVYTNLYTGQEKREIPFATHAAATVEMAPLREDFDCVVIDEIQMIADEFRGFAWTRALLGIRCKEIHVCGGLEAKDVVEKLAKSCGDEFELRTYQRFTDLNVGDHSLSPRPSVAGSYRNVQPGDCVVAFSRNDIFAIKREIESSTKHKCCIIYGTLPPETRTEQARLFNDPDSGYDVLVASDAIGMGLNLSIRRIIFNSIFKSDGEKIIRLNHSMVKQIAGRAGRRNSPFPEGEVTCRDPEDMSHLISCMTRDISPIRKAGLLPTATHIQVFYDTLEKFEQGKELDELHKILVQFSEMATVKGDFFLCRQTPIRIVAKWLDDVELPLEEKYTMCQGPINTNSQWSLKIVKKFASKRAQGGTAGLSRLWMPKQAKAFEDLSGLCSLHHELELFLWLYQRFPPGNVVEQQTALALKEKVIDLINKSLSKSESLRLDHCYISRDRKLRQSWKKDRRHATDKDLVADFIEHDDVDDI